MNTTEIEIFNMRLVHFTSLGAAGAEVLADLLVQRDRDADPLSRYETQLDRKFERTLGMLIKLKELRLG